MKRLLTCSGLSVLLMGLFTLPAYSGSESVENPDSSIVGDTFSPNNIIGLIQRLIAPIRGASATVSENGESIMITVPSEQVEAVIERVKRSVRLQIKKYTVNDVSTLQSFADGETVSDVLQQAIITLQQTDPARAARIQSLVDQLNRLLAAINTSASIDSNAAILVAAHLEALSGELRAENSTLSIAQAVEESDVMPLVEYEPSLAGEVVSTVEEHNRTIQSLNDQDAQALASDTSFIVIADLLEQIAGELRGRPVPEEELKPIPDIIASLSS